MYLRYNLYSRSILQLSFKSMKKCSILHLNTLRSHKISIKKGGSQLSIWNPSPDDITGIMVWGWRHRRCQWATEINIVLNMTRLHGQLFTHLSLINILPEPNHILDTPYADCIASGTPQNVNKARPINNCYESKTWTFYSLTIALKGCMVLNMNQRTKWNLAWYIPESYSSNSYTYIVTSIPALMFMDLYASLYSGILEI